MDRCRRWLTVGMVMIGTSAFAKQNACNPAAGSALPDLVCYDGNGNEIKVKQTQGTNCVGTGVCPPSAARTKPKVIKSDAAARQNACNPAAGTALPDLICYDGKGGEVKVPQTQGTNCVGTGVCPPTTARVKPSGKTAP